MIDLPAWDCREVLLEWTLLLLLARFTDDWSAEDG